MLKRASWCLGARLRCQPLSELGRKAAEGSPPTPGLQKRPQQEARPLFPKGCWSKHLRGWLVLKQQANMDGYILGTHRRDVMVTRSREVGHTQGALTVPQVSLGTVCQSVCPPCSVDFQRQSTAEPLSHVRSCRWLWWIEKVQGSVTLLSEQCTLP